MDQTSMKHEPYSDKYCCTVYTFHSVHVTQCIRYTVYTFHSVHVLLQNNRNTSTTKALFSAVTDITIYDMIYCIYIYISYIYIYVYIDDMIELFSAVTDKAYIGAILVKYINKNYIMQFSESFTYRAN